MSNVSQAHTVNKFVSGKSQALTGQRLVKVGYKLTDAMKKKGIASVPDSICVSVPPVQTEYSPEELKALMPYISAILEDAQNGIVRKLYEANRELSQVLDSELSFAACMEYLDEAESNRLTLELLGTWFVESLQSAATEFIRGHAAKKFSGKELDEITAKQVKGYKDMLCALSGGATIYNATQRQNLETILGLSGGDDLIAPKLVKRLEKMAAKERKDMEDMGMVSFA